MTAKLAKESIDLGIVVRDRDAALRFYRDTLGLPQIGEQASSTGGAVIVRLACGATHLKLWTGTSPKTTAAPGGPGGGATGNRYWTMHVKNLDEIIATCGKAGYKVVWEPREIRPGVWVGMVEDPDGNWVEFLENR